jgi:hypothetical protein
LAAFISGELVEFGRVVLRNNDGASFEDPACAYEGSFWWMWTRSFDETTRIVRTQMEEDRHTKLLFGDYWLDDDQPDIPDDDPRWQQHEAHMAQFTATLKAELDQRDAYRTKRVVGARV